MFSFKFRNGDTSPLFNVTCSNDFTRLGYSAGYFYATATESYDNALHHRMTTEKYVLWSYATPILYVRVVIDHDAATMKLSVRVNEDSWHCSNTTIRHVSRFMNYITDKYTLGCGFSYHDLKQIMLSRRMHFMFDAFSWIEHHGYQYQRDVYAAWYRVTIDELEDDIKRNVYPTPLVEISD